MIAIVIGLGATLSMDLWNQVLRRAFGVPSLDYCLLGRWVLNIPSGTFRHASRGAAARRRGECVAGWITHYAIGVTLAVVFVAIVSPAWLAQPRLSPALVYGLLTVVFPMFVMQPALGLGVASSKVAHPWQARAKSVGTHLVFGVGLFAAALIVSAI
jgi:hypothetical protein